MEKKILARHPDKTKQGVNISKEKYDIIREQIVNILRENGEVVFKDLPAIVKRKLKGRFDGSISWYTTVVKLDLEARKVIERVPQTKPQRVRLK
jgi:hypothetical protein